METVESAPAHPCLASWLSALALRVKPSAKIGRVYGGAATLPLREMSRLLLWSKSFGSDLGGVVC